MRVAVITPTYNRGDNGLLFKAMRSVQGQTHRDYVHLVVDHGSTDGTADMVKREFGGDSRFYYTRIDRDPNYDKGSVVGCNHGIRLVLKDPYFSDVDAMCYLHDDDMLPQRSLEMRAGAMEDNAQLRMVYGHQGICNKYMDLLYIISGPNTDDPRKLSKKLIKTRTGFPNHTVMVRRDLLKELGGFDENLFWGDDRDFSIRSMKDLASGEMLPIPEIVYYFRLHPYSAGALSPFKETDHDYIDRKHGRTKADAFMEELYRVVLRPHSLLPEAAKAKLRPVRDMFRHRIRMNSYIDPYIAAIESGSIKVEASSEGVINL